MHVDEDGLKPRAPLGWGGAGGEGKRCIHRRQVLEKLHADVSHDPTIPHLSGRRGSDDGVWVTVGMPSVTVTVTVTASQRTRSRSWSRSRSRHLSARGHGHGHGPGHGISAHAVMAAIFTTAPNGTRRQCPGQGHG